MANEALRSALVKARLEIEDLADHLQVDAKTAQRWLGGRVPHARHRAKIAALLDTPEPLLWPDAVQDSRPADDRQELSGIFASRSDLRAPDWRTLLTAAQRQVDLLDFTMTEILTTPGVTDRLAEKARAGCQIRLLIAHPKSIWVTELAQQLGQATDEHGNTSLDHDINESLRHLEALRGEIGIETRTFWAARSHTVLRFDEQMLVIPHLHGQPAERAPILHLQQVRDDGLFAQFAQHLQSLYEQASDPLPRWLVNAPRDRTVHRPDQLLAPRDPTPARRERELSTVVDQVVDRCGSRPGPEHRPRAPAKRPPSQKPKDKRTVG
jgi:hypothetical protein